LQIELTIGGEPTRAWLARELPALARVVGTRLERPLRLTILAAARGLDSAAHADWPRGSDA
jgi:hypothetical protein